MDAIRRFPGGFAERAEFGRRCRDLRRLLLAEQCAPEMGMFLRCRGRSRALDTCGRIVGDVTCALSALISLRAIRGAC